MKFLKVGRVAIITRGRYAGKKVGLPPKSNSSSSTSKQHKTNIFEWESRTGDAEHDALMI